MRGLIEKVKKSDHITVLENVSIDRIMTKKNTIYGSGNTSKKIIKVLKSLNPDLQKKLDY